MRVPQTLLSTRMTLIDYLALQTGSKAATTGAILALLLHPQVQKRAQSEIDSVVGRDRLPEFLDRERLPYITAIGR